MSQVCCDTCFWFVSRLFSDFLSATEVVDGTIIFYCESEITAEEVCPYSLENIQYNYKKYQNSRLRARHQSAFRVQSNAEVNLLLEIHFCLFIMNCHIGLPGLAVAE
jgi:hypothetical protein